jgi:hypothetical protein
VERNKPTTYNIDGVIRSANPRRSKRRLGRQWQYIIGICTIVILSVGCVLMLYNRNTDSEQPVIASDVQIVKSSVSKHFLLPSDEEPALATVTDLSKLNSALKAKAQNGDRVLIYQNNRIAILYRPSIDRVIDITPVSIDNPTSPAN